MCSYAACTLAELRTTSLQGKDFLESFQEDFAQWKERHFSQINRAFRRELIAILSDKGIVSHERTGITKAGKLDNIVQGNCTVRDDTTRGTAGYPILPPLPSQVPDRPTLFLPLLNISYNDPKGKGLVQQQPIQREGPKATSPVYSQTPHDPYLRSPAARYAELPRQQDNILSYYY